MTILIDPEETETSHLLEFTGDLTGKRVLEIGSGDGRMTWRFANQTEHVVGIDPSAEKISCAIKDLPPSLATRVTFHDQGLEEFAASLLSEPQPQLFHLAILSWSL